MSASQLLLKQLRALKFEVDATIALLENGYEGQDPDVWISEKRHKKAMEMAEVRPSLVGLLTSVGAGLKRRTKSDPAWVDTGSSKAQIRQAIASLLKTEEQITTADIREAVGGIGNSPIFSTMVYAALREFKESGEIAVIGKDEMGRKIYRKARAA